MTKQTINVGTTANDKKGDSLRAAFTKVNANFTELYTTLAGFNLTNSIPPVSGNSGKYLSTNGTTLSWITPPLIPTDLSQLTDTTNILGSVITVVATSTTPPASPFLGQLWYDTDSGRMYIYYDNTWVDANPRI